MSICRARLHKRL